MSVSDWKYPLVRDTIDSDDINELIDWLRTYPRLTMGPETLAFEEKWSRWLGRKYSVFCNSGSSANFLMYAVLRQSVFLGTKPVRVVVPSAGWPTTIAPVMQLKGFARPLMCEVDPETFGLDLNHCEYLVKRYRPQIVTFVQVLGVPNKMDELLALERRYGFLLVEDACAAMGSSYRGRKVGTFGIMSSFSTYFGHQFSTIEGGLVSTDDHSLYETLLMLRSHGWDRDLSLERQKTLRRRVGIEDSASYRFLFNLPGYNLRPTDLQAKIGIRQLDKMEWLTQRRCANHRLYAELLGSHFIIQKPPSGSMVCSIHFCFLATDERERRIILKALQDNGIETRFFVAANLGRHPFWTDKFGEQSLRVADQIYETGVFLPNNPSLSEDDIRFICDVVLRVVKKEGAIDS